MEIAATLQNGLTLSQTQGPLRTHIDAMFLHIPLFAEGLGATSSTQAHPGSMQTTLLKTNLSSNPDTQSYASKILNGPKPPNAKKQKDKGKAKESKLKGKQPVPNTSFEAFPSEEGTQDVQQPYETQDHNGQYTQSQGDYGLVIQIEGPSSEGNKGNKAPKTDAQGFQTVNKKNWSKTIKPNKPPPNKFHNRFQPLLTKVYDPCRYALSDDQFEEPEVPLEQHQRMPDQEKDIPFHEVNPPSQPNKEIESKSSSDSEEDVSLILSEIIN
ncbi:hypothetical protein L7F22_046354 [Adiantum nelumboides]|nr:hypothetical protein [Adiantum nelumboides]